MTARQVKQNIKLLYKQAEKLRDQGVYFQAIELYKKLLPLFKQVNNKPKYGRTIFQIGLCYRMANQNKKALQELDKAIKFFTKIKNNDRLAYTYREIGTVYLNLEKFSQAQKWYQKSVTLLEKSEDSASYGMSLARLGLTEMHLQHYALAEKLLLRGRNLLNNNNHWFFEITALYFLGKFYYWRRNYQKSISYLEEAESILDHHQQTDINLRRYSQIWGFLANNYLRLGKIELAKGYFLKALQHLFSMPNDVATLIYRTIQAKEFFQQISKLGRK